MSRRKHIAIQEKAYPNPYGFYEVTISRFSMGHWHKREYRVNDDRGNRILDIIGRARIDAELEGGSILLSGIYPPVEVFL